MTQNCPSDAELERLLADQLSEGEEKALESHVISCPVCVRRLEQFTRGVRALPPWSVGFESGERGDRCPPWLTALPRYLPAGEDEAKFDP
jgi:hypothetical protein